MGFCKYCGNQLSDGVKFCPKCGKPVVDIEPQQQTYSYQPQPQPQPAVQKPLMPDSYTVWAILTKIFCCLPTGIYAIMQANKVGTLYASGQYNEAGKASEEAKKWSIYSAIIGLASYFIYGLLSILAS